MINVDLQKLIQALDAETRRDLESSAERCVARGGSKILIEDLLLGLLEHPQGLLARALQDAEVDAGEFSAVLQSRVEHSASRNPVFAPELVQWLQDALLVANLELGQTQVCRLHPGFQEMGEQPPGHYPARPAPGHGAGG